MLSLLSLVSRSLGPPTWTSTAHSLLSLGRAAYSTSQDTKLDQEFLLALKRQDINAYKKWRYRNDNEYRHAMIAYQRNYRTNPESRERHLAQRRKRGKTPDGQQRAAEYHARSWRENLSRRRSTTLFKFLNGARWSREGWTWRLHEPVITPDPVNRYCTACQRDRFLKTWWATKAERITYMCSPCFANDFDIMVPEGEHKRLPVIFTSPHLPHPPSAKK